MLYRISVTERGLTGIANIFRSRLSRLDDLLRAGTVALNNPNLSFLRNAVRQQCNFKVRNVFFGPPGILRQRDSVFFLAIVNFEIQHFLNEETEGV